MPALPGAHDKGRNSFMYQGERAFVSSASVTCRIFPAAARSHSPGRTATILRFSGCFSTSYLWHRCCTGAPQASQF